MAFFSAQSHKYLLPNLLHNDEVACHIDTAGFVSTIELDYYNSEEHEAEMNVMLL